MKKILFFLLLIASCTSPNPKQDGVVIHDLSIDFPTMDTLEFTHKRSFEILSDVSQCRIIDTVLFVSENNPDNFGHCYSLNSGEKLSVMVGRGKAANEMLSLYDYQISGDSIHFIDAIYQKKLVKTFALNDILTKPMSERDFSITELPENVYTAVLIKADNGRLFGVDIDNSDKQKEMYFTYNGTELSFFGEFRKELFEPEVDVLTAKLCGINRTMHIISRGDKIIMANFHGIMLQIVDIADKTVDFERYYNKVKANKSGCRPLSDYNTYGIYCNDKNIYVLVIRPDGEKLNEEGEKEECEFLLVYDWKLKPVKKYYLGKKRRFFMSKDCQTFYYMTLGDEKQELYECKL